MGEYFFILALIGFAGFSMVWMPRITKVTGISYAVFYMLVGVLIYLALPQYLPNPLPQQNAILTLHLSELIVIISLMAAGIRIDRKFSFKGWSAPLRLIAITMMLTILVTALVGYYFLQLGLAASLLLAAALAPTDPVLASDVQAAPPNHPEKSEPKFILTSEAGINDGIAFPFTWLAITVALMSGKNEGSLLEWLAWDFFYRILAGLLVGFLVGKLVGYIVFILAERNRLLATNDGILGVSVTLLVYGITEIIDGYGFIAVFVCALSFRHSDKKNDYHQNLHKFTDQTERFILAILLLLFGGCLANGVLQALSWQMAIYALCFIFIVRPLFGFLAMINQKSHLKEKLAVSFFGIRGLGSIFYLAFGISKFNFAHQDQMWSLVFFVILVSIIVHGFSANFVMNHLKKLGGRK